MVVAEPLLRQHDNTSSRAGEQFTLVIILIPRFNL